MQPSPTPKAFRHWLKWSDAGQEITYTSEAERHEDNMDIAREASSAGRVVLFRRRLNGELVMVARIVSGAGRRFVQRAPRIGTRGHKTYQDPRDYVPFVGPSGRGLRKPFLPDGFDGPASRRFQPVVSGGLQDDDA